MKTVNIHEAKTHFSKLLEAALAGEEIIIAKAGQPIIKLVPICSEPRKPGAAAGKGKVSESFFEELSEDELTLWQ